MDEQTKKFLNTQREAEYMSNAMKYQNSTLSTAGREDKTQDINGEQFTIKFTALNETVVLEKVERNRVRTVDGLIVPDTVEKNTRTDVAEVTSIGDTVPWSDLQEGDTVLYDTHSVFRTTYPICWVTYENVIAKIDEDDNMTPIGDFILVIQKEENTTHQYEGLLEMPDSIKDVTKFYEVIAIGPEVTKVAVGDKLLYRADVSNIELDIKGEKQWLVKEGTILGKLPV